MTDPEWTFESLRIYLETFIQQVDRRHEELLAGHAALDMQRQADTEAALEKASESLEKRLDGMNEFRDQLREQASSFLPRAEYDRAHEALLIEVKRFSEVVLSGSSRSTGRGDVWGWIIGASSIILVIATLIYYSTR